MNILNFATNDNIGGAASATYRLHKSLLYQGQHSRIVVRNKLHNDNSVYQVIAPAFLTYYFRIKHKINCASRTYAGLYLPFNFDEKTCNLSKSIYSYRKNAFDIVCLHWITAFLRAKDIETIYNHFKCPIVWVLMDQEPVTGGCHYSNGCDKYKYQCGSCPQLNSTQDCDHSRKLWFRKKKYLQHLPITFVAPTHWCADHIKQSSLFCENKIERISIPIDTSVFRPFDKMIARDLLHLPLNKKIIFFGAQTLDEPRKGMKYLFEAFDRLTSLMENKGSTLSKDDLFIVYAGRKDIEKQILPFANSYLGHFNDDVALALAYQAADIFVCPSVEDAGPMMISESMLCGTPVVAFNSGGAPDLVQSGKTGYLAQYKDSSDLANGMLSLLSALDLSSIGAAAHDAAAKLHTPSIVAQQHIELYNRLLSQH